MSKRWVLIMGKPIRLSLSAAPRCAAEISQLHDWGAKLGDDHTLPLPALAEIGGTALIGDGEIKMMENNLPSTFVPGRNLLFLTYGAALAYRRGLGVLVGGMCETDYSGYPDCRRDTLDALQSPCNKGMESDITHRHAAYAYRQGRDLGNGRKSWAVRCAGRFDCRAQPHMLSR